MLVPCYLKFSFVLGLHIFLTYDSGAFIKTKLKVALGMSNEIFLKQGKSLNIFRSLAF